MRGTLEGTGSLCNRGRARGEKPGAGSGCQVACGVCHIRVSAFMCVWNLGGVSVCPLRVYPGPASSRPPVLACLSLATKSRIYEGGRSEPPNEHPSLRRPLTSLSFPKPNLLGSERGHLARQRTQASGLRSQSVDCPFFLFWPQALAVPVGSSIQEFCSNSALLNSSRSRGGSSPVELFPHTWHFLLTTFP